MKTFKNLLMTGIICLMLNSCVYSIFPIYTEDTLVFTEELLGKWYLNESKTDFILFERKMQQKKEEKEEYKYSIKIKEGFTMSSDDPIFIIKNGEKIYDENRIREEMLKSLAKSEEPEISPSPPKKASTNDRDFKGTFSMSDEKSYILTYSQNGKEEKYLAHLVQIGDDLFMDLYPEEVEYDANFSVNFFPVHTFHKVNIRGDKLDLTFFDLDKLNKLFESNLIRLRHENVNGNILITAQPKELQKFLDRYADDESVFEETETYQKAS